MIQKLNAVWHTAHKMPKNPTVKERLFWHAEHMKNCACRKPNDKLLAQMKEVTLYERKHT